VNECNITIIPDSDGNSIEPITCGAVSYTSQNRYYVDQNFIYEGGALILSQGEPVFYDALPFDSLLQNTGK